MVNFRLYRNYFIPSIIKKKVSQQFVNFFRIVERIKRLAYRLKLLLIIKIHPVISIAYLKSATNPDKNPFRRRRL